MSDRKALIRLASTLPKGSNERKAILTGLKKTAADKRAATDDKKKEAGPKLYDALRALLRALPDDDFDGWEDSSQARQIEDLSKDGEKALKDAGGGLW